MFVGILLLARGAHPPIMFQYLNIWRKSGILQTTDHVTRVLVYFRFSTYKAAWLESLRRGIVSCTEISSSEGNMFVTRTASAIIQRSCAKHTAWNAFSACHIRCILVHCARSVIRERMALMKSLIDMF